jgi:cadherin domain-containing protein
MSGTASSGDYTGLSGVTVTIPAGAYYKKISIQPTQDNNFQEGSETVILTATATATSPYILSGLNSATVIIADVNRPPKVADKFLTVTPNASSIIYNVNATDPDTGQTLSYSLWDNNTGAASTQFAIDNSGNITLAVGFLTQPTYDLTVEVTDNGGPPPKDATAQIFISVANFNAAPYSVNVPNSHLIKTDPTSGGCPCDS